MHLVESFIFVVVVVVVVVVVWMTFGVVVERSRLFVLMKVENSVLLEVFVCVGL